MNTDIFIYDKMPRSKNYGIDIDSTTTVYIHPSLLQHQEWITYNKGYLIRYTGVRDFLLEMAFITNLAYTYKISGKEVFQISPFYIQSLYNAMDWETSISNFNKQYSRTINVLKTSRMMKDYLNIVDTGRLGHNTETGKRAFFYSKYQVTDTLKEFASTMDWNDVLLKIDLKEIADKAKFHEKIPCMKDKLYIVTKENGVEEEFHSLVDARRWCESHSDKGYKPTFVQTPNRVVRNNIISKHTLREIHDMNCESTSYHPYEGKPVSISNTVFINRSEIEKMLMDNTTGSKYSFYIVKELMRMYDSTTNDNTELELKYFQTSYGRHYTQGSAIQLFPKELRERVLSEYIAVDMECSIFSLYKNLGRKYGYTKDTPQIDEIIRDRRAYRERFVSSVLPYDGVKTILTAIAYGAVVDIYNMYMEINFEWKCYRKSSLLACGYNKNSVMNMCNTDEIQDLVKELRSLGRFIINKCSDEEKNYIINYYGNKLPLNVNHRFGVKMAHIYQSYESAILTDLRNVVIENQSLGCIDNAIGLYLHDGIYIHKDIVKRYDVCSMFSKRIKETFDFDISYEVE